MVVPRLPHRTYLLRKCKKSPPPVSSSAHSLCPDILRPDLGSDILCRIGSHLDFQTFLQFSISCRAVRAQLTDDRNNHKVTASDALIVTRDTNRCTYKTQWRKGVAEEENMDEALKRYSIFPVKVDLNLTLDMVSERNIHFYSKLDTVLLKLPHVRIKTLTLVGRTATDRPLEDFIWKWKIRNVVVGKGQGFLNDNFLRRVLYTGVKFTWA